MVVLGEPAHENGLGISLLERLEKKYEEISGNALQYCNILTDNYRCNQQIAKFLSKLFYSGKAHHKISVPFLPKMKSAFVFYCCDVEQLDRAPQEATFEVEADAVIRQLKFYYRNGRDFKSKQNDSNTDTVSVITPNRNQVIKQLCIDACQYSILKLYQCSRLT